MQKMHWCTAKVNLSGQNLMTVWYDPFQAISWPEVQTLMAIHGEENVFEITPVAVGDCNILAEKQRLGLKYTFKPVEHVFPGRNPRMETLMPGQETLILPEADEEGRFNPFGAPIAITGGNGHPIEEPEQNVPPPPAPPENGDDDEEDAAAPLVDPSTAAVFKPGRHARPHKGA